jgi:hypothetical protein
VYQSRPGSGKLRQCSCDTSSPSCNPGARTVRWLLFLFAIVAVLYPPAFAQCHLKVQGAFPFTTFATQRTVTATADCGAGTVGINWGDLNDQNTSSGTSPLVINHTFSNVGPQLHFVSVSGSDGSATEYLSFQTEPDPSATFAGAQSSQVTAPVAVLPLPPPPTPPPSIAPITIHFECGSAIDSNGKIYPDASAAPLYITCNSIPANVSFAFNQSQNATVEVGTSGLASTFGSVRFPTKETYAAWAMTPIVLFLGVRIRRRRARLGSLLGVCAILCLSLSMTSCGGGFSSPSGTQATQAGQYQVNVISVPNGSTPTGFVQTTLIVPLTVSQTQ